MVCEECAQGTYSGQNDAGKCRNCPGVSPTTGHPTNLEGLPPNLTVVENDEHTHNLIVCTLCSCYPRGLLGPVPTWYKARSYRARAVRQPRELLREAFGVDVPRDVKVRVHDSTADLRYMVLPERPAGTEGWDEDRLRELVTRDSMVGVATARALPA